MKKKLLVQVKVLSLLTKLYILVTIHVYILVTALCYMYNGSNFCS